MKDLTFGEQVKIILSRKGMTIKELAEQIQEETGKAMSRQNLTQRLGRDNFQEQDMRMIAKILGCPFRLSIFPTDNEEDFNIDEEALLNYVKKTGHKKKEKEDQEEVYQQEFVFDEMMTASVAEMPVAPAGTETVSEEESAEITEETTEETTEEIKEIKDEFEEIQTETAVEEDVVLAEEDAEPETEEETTEHGEEVYKAAEELDITEAEESEELSEELSIAEAEESETLSEELEIEEPEPVKQDRFLTGTIFLRGFGRNRNKKNKKADRRVDKVEEVKAEAKSEEKLEMPEEKSEVIPELPKEEPVVLEEPETPVIPKKSKPVITPESEEFEPIVKHQEEKEDLSIGELNPYTGREYQTNSVRMHPSKIGFVQVYDRTKHGWVDMTEWAFLGYQEEKKKMLGRNYEPPIYLD